MVVRIRDGYFLMQDPLQGICGHVILSRILNIV